MARGKFSKALRSHNRHNGGKCAPSALHQRGGKKYNKKHTIQKDGKTSKFITYNGKSYMVLYELINGIPIINSIIKNKNCVTYTDLENCVVRDIDIRNGVSRILYSEVKEQS